MRADKLRDGLLNASVVQVAKAVMAVADSLQRYPAEVQLGALAYGFAAYARLTGQNPQDTFTAVNNIALAGEELRPEFKAAEEYLKKEVLNEGY